MEWLNFTAFAFTATILWLIGSVLVWFAKHNKPLTIITHSSYLAGIALLVTFIVLMGVEVNRPLFRTLGEIRLWYSLFMLICGFFIYLRWKFPWILGLAFLFALVLVTITYLNPESWEKEINPVLQSRWYVAHVLICLTAYTLLGISWLMALRGIWFSNKKEEILIENFVYAGFVVLTLGLISGMLWANQTRGDYWVSNFTETINLVAWIMFLIYIHLRHRSPEKIKAHLWTLVLLFGILMLCWYGVKFLPTAYIQHFIDI
jgi:ABC-type transport system involved in cytochrome c biogenesis permease subunit